MFPIVFPHFLFKKRKSEVLTNDLLVSIHVEILDSVHEMQKNHVTKDQITNHIDRVNRMMRNKWGNDWIDFTI